MGKTLKLLIVELLLLLCLSNSNDFAYLIPENEVREIETQDNEICLARGTNTETEFGIKFYWDCRKQLIDMRIKDSINLKGKNKFYTTELKRIKKVINNVIARIESEFETKLSYYTDEHPDYKVILRGPDQYYYNLLTFLNFNYPRLSVNDEREIKQILKTREKLRVRDEENTIKHNLEKFPECVKYDIKSKEFEDCINFKNKVEECKAVVEEKIKNRDVSSKFSCKQQSIEKYPDYMALYNSEYTDLKNQKLDKYNIDRKKELEREKRLSELNKLMSGPRLSKVQLIELRKYEEQKCLMDKELENNLFKLTISNQCENMLREREKEKENAKQQ